jgi:hypothetical protein
VQTIPDLEHASRQGDARLGGEGGRTVTRLEDGEFVIKARADAPSS